MGTLQHDVVFIKLVVFRATQEFVLLAPLLLAS